MKSRKRLFSISIFVVLCIVSLVLWHKSTLVKDSFIVPGQQSKLRTIGDSPSSDKDSQKYSLYSWEVWLDEQTEIQTEALLEEIGKQMPYELAGAKQQIETLRAQMRLVFEQKVKELKQNSNKPPPVKIYDFSELSPPENQEESGPKKHNGPQTVEALLESFEKMAADPAIDEKYPQAEWLQMLLDKGITIKDFSEYSGYMAPRWGLAQREHQPEEWTSGKLGIPPTNDWNTYKTAYIKRKIWEHQQLIAAKQMDPMVEGGFFTGPNQETFLPFTPGRVYVRRIPSGGIFNGERLSEEQQFDILFRGEHPDGYDIVYISGDGHALSEKPPLITRQEVSTPPEDWEPLPPKGDLVKQTSPSNLELKRQENPPERNPDPTSKTAEYAEVLQRQVEQGQREAIKFATMSDSELEAEIKKLLIPELPTDENIEAKLRKQFNATRLQQAIVTLNRYGPEEGLRRLKNEDTEIAEQFEQIIRRQQPLRPTGRENLREESPQED